MALNLEVPIELLDFNLPATASGDILRSTVRLNDADYDGSPTWYFEIIASNAAVTSRAVYLKGAGATKATITIPNGVAVPTRYRSASFTPVSGAADYLINITADANVREARIIIQQTNATKTRIQIPLTSKNSGSTEDDTGQIMSTTSTTPVDSTNNFGLWKRDDSVWSAFADGTPWTLEAILKSNTGTAYASLYNNTDSAEITASTASTLATSYTRVSTDFATNATNFHDLDDFRVTLRSSSGSTAYLGSARLYITLTSLSKAEIYYRIMEARAAKNTTTNLNHRALIDVSKFNSPTFYFEMCGFCADNQIIANLYESGTNDSGTTGTGALTPSSDINFVGTSVRSIVRSSSVSLTNSYRYLTTFYSSTNNQYITHAWVVVQAVGSSAALLASTVSASATVAGEITTSIPLDAAATASATIISALYADAFTYKPLVMFTEDGNIFFENPRSVNVNPAALESFLTGSVTTASVLTTAIAMLAEAAASGVITAELFSQADVALTVNDAFHAVSSDVVAIDVALTVNNASHAVASDNVDLQGFILVVQDAIHSVTSSFVDITYKVQTPPVEIMPEIVYYIDLVVYDPVLEATKTLRYATFGGVYGGNYYEPRVKQPGSFRQHMFKDGATNGESEIGYGEVILVNVDGGLDSLIDYGFAGRSITITVKYHDGDIVLLSGTMEQPTFSWKEIAIRIKNRQLELNTPIQTTKYAGTNSLPDGLEGVSDIQGKSKPLLFGQCKNITPVLVNTSRLIYQVNDGAIITTNAAVYDNGVALTKGADYASQADMETNAPAAGAFRLWLAGGYFRLGSTPAGQITADITQGATAADQTAAQIAKQIVLRVLTSDDLIEQGFTDLAGKNSAVIGLYIDREMTVNAALDIVCKSVGACHGFDNLGKFRIRRLDSPNPWKENGYYNLPSKRTGHTLTLQTQYIYLFGGKVDGVASASVIRQDLTNPTLGWDDAGVTDLPATRYDHGTAYYSQYAYMVGGYVAGVASASVIRLNIVSSPGGAWDDAGVTDLPAPRTNHACAVYGTYLYVIGGLVSGVASASVIRLDLTNPVGAWDDVGVTDLPYAVYGHRVNQYSNILVVVGGMVSGAASANVRYLDLTSPAGAWQTLYPNLPEARRNHAMWLYQDVLYVFGGYVDEKPTNSVISMKLSATTKQWKSTDTTELPAVKYDSVAVYNTLYDIVLLIGGNTKDTFYIDIMNPRGTPIATLSDSQILSIEREATSDDGRGVPAYRAILDYDKNATVQIAGLAGSVAVTTRNWLMNEFRSVKAEDLDIQTIHTFSPEMRFETNLVSSTEAIKEVNRLLSIYKRRRDLLSVDVKISELKFAAGGYWDSEAIADMPDGRYNHAAVVYNNFTYVFGGSINGALSDSVIRLDMTNPNKEWDDAGVTNLPAPRSYHAAVLYGSYVYIIGGWIGAANTASVIRLDLSNPTGSWDDVGVTDLPAARAVPSAVVSGTYVYVLGGDIGGSGTASVIRLDLANPSGAWDDAGVSDFPAARYNFPTVANGGYLYAISGQLGASTYTSAVSRLDTANPTGGWTDVAVTALPQARYRHNAIIFNGAIWVIGGWQAGYRPNVIRLSLSNLTGSWDETLTPFPVYITSMTSVVHNNAIYVIGGYTWSDSADHAYLYRSNDNILDRSHIADIGRIIRLEIDRFKYEKNKHVRIIGTEADYANNKITLYLWG